MVALGGLLGAVTCTPAAPTVTGTPQAEIAMSTPFVRSAEPTAFQSLPKRCFPSTSFDERQASATISGRLNYPSDFIPELEVLAYTSPGSDVVAICTNQGQSSYSLAVAPGTYYVFARPLRGSLDDKLPEGYYTRWVACGQKATCRDHSMIPSVVKAGQTLTGVDLYDWYSNVQRPP